MQEPGSPSWQTSVRQRLVCSSLHSDQIICSEKSLGRKVFLIILLPLMIIFQKQQRQQAMRNQGGHSEGKKPLNQCHCSTDHMAVVLAAECDFRWVRAPHTLSLPSACPHLVGEFPSCDP